MKFNVVRGEHATAARLCKQRFAVVSTDETAIGTDRMLRCTGLVLFAKPASEGGKCVPSAVGHVEARRAGVYHEEIEASLRKMMTAMKHEDGSRMALVLVGALSSGEDDHAALEKRITGLQIAEADILDLRSGGAGVGSGTSDLGQDRYSGVVFRPATGQIEVFGSGSQPDDAGGGTGIICIQDDPSDKRGVESKASGCRCVIL